MITDQNKYKKMYENNEFEKLVEPIYKDLFRFIFSLTKNKILTEEAFQNTLIKAYEHFRQLRDKKRFKSWIFTIGKFEILAMYKKHLKRLEVPIEESISYIPIITYDSTADMIINKERKEYIIGEIKRLKKIYREIIIIKNYP